MSFCGEDKRRQIKSVFFCLGMAIAACNASQYVIWQLEMKRKPKKEGIRSLKKLFKKRGIIVPIPKKFIAPDNWKTLLTITSITRKKAEEWTKYFNRIAQYFLQKEEEF